MQFLLLIAVVTAVAISESTPAETVAGALPRLLAALAVMAAVPLVAAIISLRTARAIRQSKRFDWRTQLASFQKLQNIHSAVWLLAAAVVYFGLDWVQLVRHNGGLAGVPFVDEIAILFPIVAPLALSWCAFYEVDLAAERRAADERETGARPMGRGQFLGTLARHHFGLLLAPVLLLLAVRDVAEWIAPKMTAGDDAWIVFLPPLAAIVVFFPLAIRRLWRTEPLPAGALRDRLEAAGRRWKFRPREILIWHTGGRMANAAVAGFVPRFRYVFLTDSLLERFSPDEIEAIYAHEVGHVRRRHLALRLLAMTTPLVVLAALQNAMPEGFAAAGARLAGVGFDAAWQGAVLTPAGMILYAAVIFGAYSRLLEREADLFAAQNAAISPDGSAMHRELPHGPPHPSNRFAAALEKLGAASSSGRRRGGWLHPSVASRVEFLDKVAIDPAARRRFQLKMRCLEGLTVASFLVGLMAAALVGQ